MNRLITTIAAAAMTIAATAANKPTEGLTYFLPKTAVRMQVLVEKTTTTPGQLANYAKIYFQKDAPTQPSADYRIVGYKFSTEGRADESKQFAVSVDKKHTVLSVDTDVNGCLLAINTKGDKAAAPTTFTPAPQPTPLNPYDYMSQDILSAGNLPKMAQLVAQEIYDIRDSRNQLSRGEADFMPKDGEQLRLMYAQLNTQEAALMQLFLGTTKVDTTEHVVTFVPEPSAKRTVVFRFSKKFGFATADDLSGEPYYMNIDNENSIMAAPAVAEEAKKEKDEFQLGVSLPGKIRLTLTADGTNKVYFETYAAQFGKVEMLSGALFGKKFTSKIKLDAATGAVTKLDTEPLE